MTGNGIRSAVPATPRVSAVDAIPKTSRPRASRLTTAEDPTAAGTLLVRPEALRRQQPRAGGGRSGQGRTARVVVSAARTSANRVSAIHFSLDRASVTRRSDLLGTRDSEQTHPCSVARNSVPLAASADLATEGLAAASAGGGIALVGSEGTATVGGQAFLGQALVGAGEVGALAWVGRTGAATGDPAGRSDGIPGGTTHTGMLPGRRTTTTRITRTAGITTRRLTIRMLRMTTTRRQAI